MFSDKDHYWMQRALELAKRSQQADEVPVGAILVLNDEMIGEGWNCPIGTSDPTAHAEMLALRAGAKALKNYRLINTTLYVTLEPCAMCYGAMVHARIARLVYGADDAKTGVIHSAMQLPEAKHFNHRIEYSGGLLKEECGQIMTDFFRKKRQ